MFPAVNAAIVGAARRIGIILERDRRLSANGYRYQTLVLRHALAPWLEPEFATLYDAVRAHTLVDAQRCYELWDLARQAQPSRVTSLRSAAGVAARAASSLRRPATAPIFATPLPVL
jgi:hypothetical protein